MKRLLMLVAAAAVVIVAVVAIRLYNKPHRAVAEAVPDVTIAASRLLDEFNNDEHEASRRYVGKLLSVTGVVKEVTQSDSSAVVVLGDSSSAVGVRCYLQPGKTRATFRRGDSIKVKGICNGMLLDVVLDRAVAYEIE